MGVNLGTGLKQVTGLSKDNFNPTRDYMYTFDTIQEIEEFLGEESSPEEVWQIAALLEYYFEMLI